MENHIGSLKPDPQNARRHSPRNLAMIESSLQDIGAARSIVIDEDGTVLAGNGVVEAAGNVGIEKLRIIDAVGDEVIAVRRTGLTPEQKQRLALFDNRSAELALWDEDVIDQLNQSIDLSSFFSQDELHALLGHQEVAESDGAPQLGELTYRVVVDCKDEAEQAMLLERFEAEGLVVRALMS